MRWLPGILLLAALTMRCAPDSMPALDACAPPPMIEGGAPAYAPVIIPNDIAFTLHQGGWYVTCPVKNTDGYRPRIAWDQNGGFWRVSCPRYVRA